MQLVTFSLLTVVAPVFTNPLATRQTDITPECQALVDAQTPATKDFFRKLCVNCYDEAQTTCSSSDGTACIETTLQNWTKEARSYGEGICTEYKTASSALFCTSDKITEWIDAGNCKA
ncbi:hypothetical protein GTA08_BOTSDO03205 [Botryosphaeria dothidea]|uniref:Uncharacterized protein n=1 Tax=Botryosphaeria dothidea TaxID=55169 RepID=A0A8H4J1U1_9PEZI|nr:hypothetical protein GTA08_BOTSDO03205 [Botryosphaeria dothidea]